MGLGLHAWFPAPCYMRMCAWKLGAAAACGMHVVLQTQGGGLTGLARSLLWLQRAADNGAQLVVLPEMWNCPYSNDSFPTYAEDIDGGDAPSVKALSEVSQ